MCVLAGRLQRQVDVLDQSSLIPCIQDPCGCVVFKFHCRKTSQTSKRRNAGGSFSASLECSRPCTVLVRRWSALGHVPFSCVVGVRSGMYRFSASLECARACTVLVRRWSALEHVPF